jgi:ketosteroid isomerase-like protein
MRKSLVIVSLLAVAACARAPERHSSAGDGEREIRSLLTAWSKAFRAKDVDGVMQIYGPGTDLVSFDYAALFEEFRGPLDVEIRDLRIISGSDVAFSYGLERMAGTLNNGTGFETWVRFTQGYRRTGGHWYAVHDHISVPAEPETGKARFDLKP